MKTFREGVRSGIVLCLKLFETHPFLGAAKMLSETAKNIETIIDEDGQPLPRVENAEKEAEESE